MAGCPAASLYTFSWTTQAAATLSYAGTYTYTASNPSGQTLTFTVTFNANGTASTIVASNQMPNISTMINDGGTTNNNLVLGGIFTARTASITSGTRTISAVLSFPTAIRDLSVQVNDIDFINNQYRDWFNVSGASGAGTYVPSIVTPFSTDNGGGAKTNASSSLSLGAATTPFNQTSSEGVGTGASGNNSNTGTLTASFAQPVTSATIAYGNYPLQSGETATGQQAMGIQSISFCPMPNLAVTKTVAPWSDPVNGTTNPKLIPGGDLVYTITVTNSGGSPVDLSTSVLTDPVPANLTFYDGDIDDAGPLTTNYDFAAGSSGLSFSAANLTYSNNGGSTYTYSPSAGYDTAVNALRFAPTGSMAANSSFTMKFRARIK